MTRPKPTSLDRLRRKVWIRALRRDLQISLRAQGVRRGVTTWAALERRLLEAYDGAALVGRLQGILGVVHHGNDPRRLVRRVREDDLAGHVPEDARKVVRRASGRTPPDWPRERHPYWEIPINLVAAGERLCPGSSGWMNAYLWRLAHPFLPRLEDLRSMIAELKGVMGLVSPSLDEYRHHLTAEDFNALAHLSHEEQVRRYEGAMNLLTRDPTANSLSLLASLVAESYITDQAILLDIHRHAFYQGIQNLFDEPLLKDVAKEFMHDVAVMILTTSWQFPASYHVSSLSEPFVPFDTWDKVVREGVNGAQLLPAAPEHSRK